MRQLIRRDSTTKAMLTRAHSHTHHARLDRPPPTRPHRAGRSSGVGPCALLGAVAGHPVPRPRHGGHVAGLGQVQRGGGPRVLLQALHERHQVKGQSGQAATKVPGFPHHTRVRVQYALNTQVLRRRYGGGQVGRGGGRREVGAITQWAGGGPATTPAQPPSKAVYNAQSTKGRNRARSQRTW